MFSNFVGTHLDLTSFYTSNVKNMEFMFGQTIYFKNSAKLEYIYLSSFNTSKVTTMEEMFQYNEKLKEVKVGPKWNTSDVNNTNWFLGTPVGTAAIKPIN